MYRKNAWLKYQNKEEVMKFAEGYKDFISTAKSERLAVKEAEKLLKANGFKNVDDVKSLKLVTVSTSLTRKRMSLPSLLVKNH